MHTILSGISNQIYYMPLPGIHLRKGSQFFGPIGKASMVGFTLLSRSYYYLRRRSPGPPFPPDHRQ